MSAKDPEIVYSGRITNHRFCPDKPNWFNAAIDSLEGKEVELTLEERKRGKTPPQLAFYFGGIIRTACMKRSTKFEGWTLREIDDHFRQKFASYPKTFVDKTGKTVVHQVKDDIAKYKVDQMNFFIERVLQYLLEEFDIEVDDPADFKLNKFLKQEN